MFLLFAETVLSHPFHPSFNSEQLNKQNALKMLTTSHIFKFSMWWHKICICFPSEAWQKVPAAFLWGCKDIRTLQVELKSIHMEFANWHTQTLHSSPSRLYKSLNWGDMYALWISITQLHISVCQMCSCHYASHNSRSLQLILSSALHLSKRMLSRQKMQLSLVKYWHAAPVVTLWLWQITFHTIK